MSLDDSSCRVSRRSLLQSAALAALPCISFAQSSLLTRPIPSSGERLPAVGLGTWITFNVGQDEAARRDSAEVMRNFFDAGGRMIDSSPMYGSSQEVVGDALTRLHAHDRVFATDKVWTSGDGAAQAETSRKLWRIARFDLLQVHNLLAWERQLPLIEKMKAQGSVRYAGITTSEGRRHDDMERVMRTHALDFIQLTYNPVDREAEQRLLPLARERGIGVIVNRPFQQGALLRRLAHEPLPGWAADIAARSWAQLVLKFIVSHPAITCAIPATSRVDHVRENMAAATGALPDEAMRQRIAGAIVKL
jgi:diketogulonate reductase-like aldo/keto reductase